MANGHDEARARRALLAGDAHRPSYHFLPPANWMNDPNGLVHWRGQYHLFYQHNPHGPVAHPMSWGHATSDDLVHWRDLPLALQPTPGSVDEGGVWSGCTVDDNGTATVLYTAVRRNADGSWWQLPCLATSTDADLRTWHKHAANPIIPAPPADLDVLAFRDHSAWREDGAWYQVIGSGIRGVGGAVLLYRSTDLVHWEYLEPMCVGAERETGTIWECPDFFALGEQQVLVISPIPLRKAIYFIGQREQQRFTPRSAGVVDAGECLYAPQSFTDERGRRIMFGWLRELRDDAAQVAAGWSGVMSLPRLLVARSDGQLGMAPVPELHALRGAETSLRDIQLESAPMRVGSGAALEIEAHLEPSAATQMGVVVRASPDGVEQTVIVYDVASRSLSLDLRQSSLDPAAHGDVSSARLELAPSEPLNVRVFVDHSVVEVFANDTTCLSGRVYPTRPDSLNVAVFATGGPADLRVLKLWELASIWPSAN